MILTPLGFFYTVLSFILISFSTVFEISVGASTQYFLSPYHFGETRAFSSIPVIIIFAICPNVRKIFSANIIFTYIKSFKTTSYGIL